MKKELEKEFNKMSPRGSNAWFYREFIKGKIENVSHAYFDMMVSGLRNMRPDVKQIIDKFINSKKNEMV